MKSFNVIALAASCYATVAQATVSTYSQVYCLTHFAPTSTRYVPTFSELLTLPPVTQKVTSTTTLTRTSTPPSVTATIPTTSIYSTTTTLIQVTDTYTLTPTYTETDTSTTTSDVTVFTTTTTTTTVSDTTTVPTSSGFVPLASGLAADGYTASKKRKRTTGEISQRSPKNQVQKAAVPAKAVSPATRSNLAQCAQSSYAAVVNCNGVVEIVSTSTVKATAKKTLTVTAAPDTVTTTSTTVITTVLTSIPVDASSTITAPASTTTLTNTATAYSTITSTITSTSTSFAAVATYYAACASNNLISQINGMTLVNGYPTYDNSALSTDTAYDCCVYCLGDSACGAVAYDTPSSTCYIANNSGGTCNPAEQDVDIATGPDVNELHLTYSNSNCGQAYYDGKYTDG